MADYGWLREAAVRAGLPGAGRLPDPPGANLQEAWEAVARTTGVSPSEVAEAVAAHFNLAPADLGDRDDSVLRLIPEASARKLGVLPLREKGRTLRVATADPANPDLLRDLEFVAGRYIELAVAPAYELSAEITGAYGSSNPVTDYLRRMGTGSVLPILMGSTGGDSDLDDIRLDLQEEPAARLVALLFQEAVALGASDLHLEPMAGGAVARFRVEGVLVNSRFMPREVQVRAVSHVKAISGMDPANRIRPQDGRARLFIRDDQYDLRISTLPAANAENMVVRLLATKGVESLADLSYREPEASQLRALFARSNGIVLMTGPTGSGKTTTLMAAIQEINRSDLDIHTIEDPVEYKIPGVVQVQVDEKQGLTFAAAIRSILRQDPDVMLVGEIRDAETAEAAKQAALSGHLVLSTLHTQDAPSAIYRLRDLDVDPAYLAEIMAGAAAQRLVRTLCAACATNLDGELTAVEQRFEVVLGERPPRRAVGCGECGQTGYRGRAPIAQVFTVTPPVAELISEGAPLSKVRNLAFEEGMRSLSRSAADLVLEGKTTPEEVVRVLGESFWLEIQYEKQREVLTEDHDHRAVNPRPRPGSGPAELRLERPEVLVLDEDPERRQRISRALEEMDYDVHVASHAADARQVMRAHQHISLMVVTLIEEGRTGREVLRDDYQALGGYPLPAVLIIPQGDEEVKQVLLNNGAVDFISAPLDVEDLKFRVAAAVRRHEMANHTVA